MILKDEVASLRSLVVGFPEHGFVRTKEDNNVMIVDEGENIVETSVGKIRKSCGATSKAKRAATSKDKRGIDESDEGTPKAFYKKKVLLAVEESEDAEDKANKSVGKKKPVAMDESTRYEKYTNSDGFTVDPFRGKDEAVRIEAFKVALYVFQKQLGVSMNVTRMAKEQEWSKLHCGDLKSCEQFHADDVKLKLVGLIVSHGLNLVKSTYLTDSEQYFNVIADQEVQSNREDNVVNSKVERTSAQSHKVTHRPSIRIKKVGRLGICT
ncbi:hypothetical protein PanWU01x14_208800 [Parasponia andersonii]|uniref:Uncharacterized protein n=1 Tax=Parasponia andersonii TaxID=3476 RepID=A0A2P5BUM0_PARAD|nr:hypothetical protein PanWU01x14_208800 [Parasponia andersonii]